ncbi:hypothetical protein SXCC_03177 [Gluconacetobacter sp. SXCC-1]|nr:hypothetical protein SXCC_03177 [Gluconacetobacter sp. SXCC-1]
MQLHKIQQHRSPYHSETRTRAAIDRVHCSLPCPPHHHGLIANSFILQDKGGHCQKDFVTRGTITSYAPTAKQPPTCRRTGTGEKLHLCHVRPAPLPPGAHG